MPAAGSVTDWVLRLRDADDDAAQKLWERYFRRLVGEARKRLRDSPRRAADEEDVALSALDSFCRGAQKGRFPQLRDRNDLWRLLVTITARKAVDLKRYEGRQKRGAGAAPIEATLPAGADSGGDESPLERILSREPTPEFAAQVADQCKRLLDSLRDESLRCVALAKMEGYSDEEIATQLRCARRTIVRKLRRIRSIWSQQIMS
jgi:DNA-directed RNA polymerase specialized sigma24 family protein